MDDNDIYVIELTRKQMQIVSMYLEMSSRMLAGQLEVSTIFPFRNILWKRDQDNYQKNYAEVEQHLHAIKSILFPHIPTHAHHAPEDKEGESNHLYEMYKQIEYLLQKEREAEGAGTNVHSGSPLKLTDEPSINVYKSEVLTRERNIDSLLDEE